MCFILIPMALAYGLISLRWNKGGLKGSVPFSFGLLSHSVTIGFTVELLP